MKFTAQQIAAQLEGTVDGDPNAEIFQLSKKKGGDPNFIGNYEKGLYQASFDNNNLTYLLKKYSKKDIAACAQFLLEKVVPASF